MAERQNHSHPFENEYCTFYPADWQLVDGVLRPIVFKVVTADWKSLGLRHNPSILTYTLGKWISLADDQTIPGVSNKGGIWSALRLSGARTLTNYMLNKYGVTTRVCLAAIEQPLFANSWRVKSQSIKLLEQVRRF